MKIYKVSRVESASWDEYDSFVVVAENEQQARYTHPDGYTYDPEVNNWRNKEGNIMDRWVIYSWTEMLDKLKVEYIGEAQPGCYFEPTIICASFNAG